MACPPTTLGLGPRMGYNERAKLRGAANRARRLYPGPVGEILYRELVAWEEFGYRFGSSVVIAQLVEHIHRAPITVNMRAG